MRKQYYRATFMMFIAIIVVIFLLALDKKPEVDGPIGEDEPVPTTSTNVDELNPGKVEIERFVDVPYDAPENISKALAVKMVALSKEDKTSVQVRDREIDFEDTSKEVWFDKYFNVAIVEGWFIPEEMMIKPLDPLTYGDVARMVKYFELEDALGDLEVAGKEKEAIGYLEWMKVYESLLPKFETHEAVEEIPLIVFSTPTLSNTLGSWQMATDQGAYSFEGIGMDSCINKQVSFLVKDKEVLAILGILQENPVLTNAYILHLDGKNQVAEVFMGGVSRNFPLDPSIKSEDKSLFIGDIQLIENTIMSLKEKNNSVDGVVKKITEQEIEVEGIGKLKLSEDVKFYSTVNTLIFSSFDAVVVGYDTATFILEESEVAAVIIRDKVEIETVRVVLNDTSYKNLFHKNVEITGLQPYNVLRGSLSDVFNKEQIFNVNEMDLAIGERVMIQPETGGQLKINTISRGGGKYTPLYRGKIEIERVEEGYIVINEVDLEDYLYSVVPSEMPTSYGLEAAKVQAVCARSYAYTQVYANRFCEYGAHVDDSTLCQVYNNTPETTVSIQAVKDTRGQLLSYKGNVISTNFFSTSCGVTSDSGDVWANYETKEFPTVSSEYLKSKYQSDTQTLEVDLSQEAPFRTFILNTKLPSFDADFPWYRWSTTLTADQIEATLNKNMSARYEAQPKLIKTLDENNIFRSRPIEEIGEILDLSVYSRGGSGIISEMIVQTTTGIYKIATEYNIRLLIAPINYIEGGQSVTITRNDGKTSLDMTLMPSAFYVMDKTVDTKGKLKTVTFSGGGYGHGVGMSQNGAKAMVDLGYKYEEILNHYYEGTELMTLE